MNDDWWLRAWMRIWNVVRALRRRPGHWYIHRHATVDRVMSDAGYALIHDGGTWDWRVAVFRRATAP